ncbi:MAG TPA: tetratricopeptide repeat protein [Spirochaetes bacterium]|nr:tetratricopeptide repeat protein [Spirochaetota bacterium]
MENGGQLTFDDDPLFVKQNKAHKLLEDGMFKEAITMYESIIEENPNYPGVGDGAKASKFWINKINKFKKHINPYDKGKLLLKEWKDFEKYMNRNHVRHGRSTVAIQKYIFCDIIESFTCAYHEGVAPDTDILIQIGDLFKKLGNYVKAIDVYEYTRTFNIEDPSLLAKLGDCYFSIDETSKAKVLFREAFFIDPGQIEIDQIESPFIHMLHKKTLEMLKNPEITIYWVPVLAEIKSAFNVKREPKKGELDELRKKIKKLEFEYTNNKKKKLYIEPRLLNHYFWLIDTLKISGGSKKEIEQSLQRINEINGTIFAEYLS